MTSVAKNITGAIVVMVVIVGFLIYFSNYHPGAPVASDADEEPLPPDAGINN
jgi:hypothetical protein